MITIFKNGYEELNAHYITIETALGRIRDGNSKAQVKKIRALKAEDKDTNKEKILLPSVIFGGKATKIGKGKKNQDTLRLDSCITEHSSVFVLDFDHIDIEFKRNQLKNDPYIHACWVSPSGDGLKALVKCPQNIEKHGDYYDSFLNRYPELDSTSRNIGRLCFESYDPDIWYNQNSKLWDKTIIKPEVVKERKQRLTEKRNNRTLSIAVDMIRCAQDGEKHSEVLKAGKLVGGYVGAGRMDEFHALNTLDAEIDSNPRIKDSAQAKKTLRDGVEYGKTQPIHEIKKIERKTDFIKNNKGEYDFLADKEEMDEYEEAVINGTLEMGLSTGLPQLDQYFMVKKNHLVFIGGIDNVGKSFVVWYLAVLQAMINDLKFVIFSAENKDGQVRAKLKEIYLGKKLQVATDEERKDATEFIDSHFKLMTSKKMYTWEGLLMHAEVLYDEGFEFDVLIAEPYNAMDVPSDMNGHTHNLKALNILRVFKENYAAVWVCDHAVSAAAREKDADGYVKVPWKSSLDGGQLKPNKTDDFIMAHRHVNHPERWNVTELHVMKIKNTETGGRATLKDDPFLMVINEDMCGFRQFDAYDPVKKYWQYKGKGDTPEKAMERVKDSLIPNDGFDKPDLASVNTNNLNIINDEQDDSEPPF